MSLVRGGDSTLKCYATIGYMTVEYLCVNKLGIDIRGYSKKVMVNAAQDVKIRQWNPTPEGEQLVETLSGRKCSSFEDRGQAFFLETLLRISRSMRHFTVNPSSVGAKERTEITQFLEIFC